jgi:hypothetical protein
MRPAAAQARSDYRVILARGCMQSSRPIRITDRVWRDNKCLISFLLGVIVTAAVAQFGVWGVNREWEMEAVSRGYGVFSFNIYDKPDWDGNQRLKFYWQDENPKILLQVPRVTRPPSRAPEVDEGQL